MTKVKVELDCLKDLLKREPIVKIVEELPAKETADLNYIYIIPKEGEGKDKKAYVLRPDRSGFDTIDLTPQVVSVLGEGYITVEKETLNENGDVTFTVKTNETLANVLKELENKDKEQDGKLTNLTDRVVALEGKADKDTIYDDTEVKQGIKANESAIQGVENDLTALRTHTDARIEALESKEDKDTIYDDSELRNKITALEERPQGSSYDDTELKGRVKALEDKPEPTPYNDKPLSDRVTALEEKVDNDTIYNDAELRGKIEALEGKTDNFVSNVGVSREGNTVKLTYTMVNGDNKEVEFTDNDTVSVAYDDTALRNRVEALENKTDKDTVYNDSELKEEVHDLGSSVASALHDISEIRVNNEQRLNALESKEDNDKQTLTLEGNTLSISNGNSVELPTAIASTAKPTKVTTDSEGVKVTHTETEDANTYNVNINGALANYYDKSKTYTKNEVDNLIVHQEEKATDITVYKTSFKDKSKVKEGDFDTAVSPRVTLTYSSSTGVGILKVDFKVVSGVPKGFIIAELPSDAPVPAELVESQVWVGNVSTSIWIDKGSRTIRISSTVNPEIFEKRIIISVPGIFKK
jgi:hypothetical protein